MTFWNDFSSKPVWQPQPCLGSSVNMTPLWTCTNHVLPPYCTAQTHSSGSSSLLKQKTKDCEEVEGCRASDTCGQTNFHSSLTVPQHFKLRQGNLVRHPHRVGPLVPFIADVPHCIPDWTEKRVGMSDAACDLPAHQATAPRAHHKTGATRTAPPARSPAPPRRPARGKEGRRGCPRQRGGRTQ